MRVRVLAAFEILENERHISVLLIEAILKESGLLISLPDPADLQAVQEFFNLNT